MQIDLSILPKAGITYETFAGMVGVSRVTVSAWANGHNTPGRSRRERVKQALAQIAAAVERGDLPLPKTDEAKRIQETLSVQEG